MTRRKPWMIENAPDTAPAQASQEEWEVPVYDPTPAFHATGNPAFLSPWDCLPALPKVTVEILWLQTGNVVRLNSADGTVSLVHDTGVPMIAQIGSVHEFVDVMLQQSLNASCICPDATARTIVRASIDDELCGVSVYSYALGAQLLFVRAQMDAESCRGSCQKMLHAMAQPFMRHTPVSARAFFGRAYAVMMREFIMRFTQVTPVGAG